MVTVYCLTNFKYKDMNLIRITTLSLLSAVAVCASAQKIKGSDTVLPVTQEAAEVYMNENPQARVTVTGGGSGVVQRAREVEQKRKTAA